MEDGWRKILLFRLGLAHTEDAVAFFPFAAFAEKVNTFETLEYAAFLERGGSAFFETWML